MEGGDDLGRKVIVVDVLKFHIGVFKSKTSNYFLKTLFLTFFLLENKKLLKTLPKLRVNCQ